MPTPPRTRLSLILPVIRQRLIDWLQFPAERVLLTITDEPPFDAQAEQYVWVRLRRQAPGTPYVEGGGRTDARVRRTLAVTVRTRQALDTPLEHLLWLLTAHLDAEHAVYDALLDFYPAGADGMNLTTEPLHPGTAAEPRADRDDPTWGESTVEFEIVYEMDLDQSFV